jgi:uncharacterized protein (DUF4213/DUF364 family)
VREKAKDLWVIEQNPQEGDFNEDEADRRLPEAEVVGVTGTSLTDHTFEHLLESSRQILTFRAKEKKTSRSIP